MATRTSSPPASRTKSTPARTTAASKSRGGGKGGSTSRSRSSGSKKPAPKRPAPRAVRNGPGPIARLFTALARVLVTAWLGLAHAVGGGARRIGHSASELEPEHRRDGAGLFLIGLAVVVAAAIWWDLPGSVGNGVRTVVGGSIGMLGWALMMWRHCGRHHPSRLGDLADSIFVSLVLVGIASGLATRSEAKRRSSTPSLRPVNSEPFSANLPDNVG